MQSEMDVPPLGARDLVITSPRGRVVVEVDGPAHFAAATCVPSFSDFNAANCAPNGPTRLRDWMLRRLGYRVVAVPFYMVPFCWVAGRYLLDGSGQGSTAEPSVGVMRYLDVRVREALAAAEQAPAPASAGVSPLLRSTAA
jgi:RAP domain